MYCGCANHPDGYQNDTGIAAHCSAFSCRRALSQCGITYSYDVLDTCSSYSSLLVLGEEGEKPIAQVGVWPLPRRASYPCRHRAPHLPVNFCVFDSFLLFRRGLTLGRSKEAEICCVQKVCFTHPTTRKFSWILRKKRSRKWDMIKIWKTRILS